MSTDDPTPVRVGMTVRYREGDIVHTGRVVSVDAEMITLRQVLHGVVEYVTIAASIVAESWWQS